jgi:hypothetical protein
LPFAFDDCEKRLESARTWLNVCVISAKVLIEGGLLTESQHGDWNPVLGAPVWLQRCSLTLPRFRGLIVPAGLRTSVGWMSDPALLAPVENDVFGANCSGLRDDIYTCPEPKSPQQRVTIQRSLRLLRIAGESTEQSEQPLHH